MDSYSSMIQWLEHRIENASYYTIPIYVGQFEDMWMEEFGTLEHIPKELKRKVSTKYKQLRKKAVS